MTTEAWIDSAISRKEVLLSLVTVYHPASVSYGSGQDYPITAPNVEEFLGPIRDEIKKESIGDQSPAEMFITALSERNFSNIYSILSETWFGVPETTACWDFTGFAEVVDLLGDLPEDQNPEDDEGMLFRLRSCGYDAD